MINPGPLPRVVLILRSESLADFALFWISEPNWKLNALQVVDHDDAAIIFNLIRIPPIGFIFRIDKTTTDNYDNFFTVDCPSHISRSPVVRLSIIVLARSTAYSHHPYGNPLVLIIAAL